MTQQPNGDRLLAMLRRLTVNGFKSIKAMDLELRPLNVLIGANGAGKSNLVSFFKMLHEMMSGRLQRYVGTTGHAQSILHFGPKVTPQMDAQLEFETENSVECYGLRLQYAAGDTLIYAEENLSFTPSGSRTLQFIPLGSGHRETQIVHEAAKTAPPSEVAKLYWRLLNYSRVYHFLDTSPTARIKQHSYINDNRWLLSDAGNLAAFLLRLRTENGTTYQSIISTIRLIAPFFNDFLLDSSGKGPDVILNWRDKGSDQVFGPHQLSDGTLRAICLITLLMQPENELPNLIIVDEPELGLHPYALNLIAALFKKASHHVQVLISIQSAAFLDNFEPEDVIVVNREEKESQFTRLDAEKLEAWLEEYSLGEVWEKNVIGGGPH